MSLPARVGERLYWAARYLERAEGGARVVREHTHLLADMPRSVTLTWTPLVDMAGERAAFAATGRPPTEEHVVRFLVGDTDNPGSIAAAVTRARENLRACREVIPVEAWAAVNDLHLFMTAHRSEDVDRRTRARLLDRVVDDHQRLVGVLAGSMTRDEAFTMLRLGRHIERVCLTTRVIDVRAPALLTHDGHDARYDDVQWIGVLRALSALHMYHRHVREPVAAVPAMAFLLRAATFPRSVAYCLGSVLRIAGRSPGGDALSAAAAEALRLVEDLDPAVASARHIHAAAARLADAAADLHGHVCAAYFTATPA